MELRREYGLTERRACAALGQHRSTQRKVPRGREDEERLTAVSDRLQQSIGSLGGKVEKAAAPAGGGIFASSSWAIE